MIKLLNKLEKLELDKKKILLIILGCLIVIYIDLSSLTKAQIRQIKNVGPQIMKLKKDIDNLNKELATIGDLKRNQAEIEQQSSLKNKKIISREQLPSVLEYISDTANQNNIKITQIKPIKERNPSKEASKFTPQAITLDLSCDYHRLGSFINFLENGEYFIAVQNMAIIPSPKDYLYQDASLVLKTYVKE